MNTPFLLTSVILFCVSLRFGINAANINNAGSSDTSKNLVNINGTNYYISVNNVAAPAASALSTCNEIGMKMISLQTKEKRDMIFEYLLTNGLIGRYWTSGIYYFDDVWLWSGTGEQITYIEWSATQPNEMTVQHNCIYMIGDTGYFGDSDCYVPYGIMCEEL